MIQFCRKSISLLLKLLFKTTLEEGSFSEQWEKVMLYQYKERVQESDKNYRPITILSIFSKSFEKKKIFFA